MNLLTPPSLASGDSLVWLSKAFMMVKSARIFWVKPVKHDMFHFVVILYQVLQQTGVFFFLFMEMFGSYPTADTSKKNHTLHNDL